MAFIDLTIQNVVTVTVLVSDSYFMFYQPIDLLSFEHG